MMASRPVSVAASLFTLTLLVFVLTACDSGGGANSEPEEIEVTVEGAITSQESENPIEGAEITASPGDDDNTLGNATTGKDGGYELSFTISEAGTPGQIRLEVNAEGFVSSQVTVGFSPEISRDIALEAATMETSASGTITDAVSGDPIGGATVKGIRSSNGDMLFETTTSSDGTYADSFEVAGETGEITIEGELDGYETTESTVTFSEEISVDLSLPVTSTVSGTITRNDTGDPVEGATLNGTRSGTEDTLFEATSGSDGTYEASYGVSDEPDQITISTKAQDYKEIDENVRYNKNITFGLALTPEEINVSIEGTVTSNEDGSGIENAVAEIFRLDDKSLLANTKTTSDGSYELTSALKAPDTPEEIRIEISKAFAHEGKKEVAEFSSSVTENFVLETAPIEVGTIQELKKIGNEDRYPIDWDYVLTSDIDASPTANWNGGKGFQPIGDEAIPFTGSLDGNGYQISQLTIDRGGQVDVGLFGYLGESSVVENVSFLSSQVKGESSVGILAGVNEGEIINLSVSGSVRSTGGGSTSDTGGMIGRNTGSISEASVNAEVVGEDGRAGRVGGIVGDNSGLITDSYSEGSVEGRRDSGGLVGSNSDVGDPLSGVIRRSQANVDVNASNAVGGLVGVNGSGVIRDSYSEGVVNGFTDVGGLIGVNRAGDVSKSHSVGMVTGTRFVGGLIGENRDNALVDSSHSSSSVSGSDSHIGGLIGGNTDGSEVKRSFSDGNVDGAEKVGGLIGQNTSGSSGVLISDCYSMSSVVGEQEVGGLIGSNLEDAVVRHSYSVGEVSGDTDVGGAIGVKSTESTLDQVVWDTMTSGQATGIGRGSSNEITGLTTDEMQGSSAEENMDGFDFENTWQTVMGDYPILSWEE
jgi:hypothetical protein